MSKRGYGVFLAIVLVLVLSDVVSAVEVIQREKQVPQSGSGVSLQGIIDFIAISWLPLVILGGVVFVVIILWKWLKTQREKENIFLRDYIRTKKLCLMQANKKRVKERAFWMYILAVGSFASIMMFVIAIVIDDPASFMLASGIFVTGISISGFLKMTKLFSQHDVIQIIGGFGVKIIGYYIGECITSDGYKNYMFWNGRKFLFWKQTYILKVNLNDTFKIEVFNHETQKREIVSYEVPKDLITEGESVIAIKGEGLDESGYYYYPLVIDEAGNIINMDLIAYAKARDVAVLDTLYQQTEDFARVQREAININPNVRYALRTRGDTVSDTGSGDR